MVSGAFIYTDVASRLLEHDYSGGAALVSVAPCAVRKSEYQQILGIVTQACVGVIFYVTLLLFLATEVSVYMYPSVERSQLYFFFFKL